MRYGLHFSQKIESYPDLNHSIYNTLTYLKFKYYIKF